MQTHYETREGDQWDAIAKEVYGDELRTDMLMKANPERLDTFTFGNGVRLRTPELPEQAGNLPPWRA